DLGARMERATREALSEGAKSVVVIGADCPQLTGPDLSAALARLREHDVVLGPAIDGGYYLIGLRRPQPELFRDIAWSTATVLAQTLATAKRSALQCHLLKRLGDVDQPHDLAIWAATPAAQVAGQGRVSVIIPTLNEAQQLPGVLAAALSDQPHEVIVVDGGSADGTPDIARAHGVIMLASAPGRAAQMNFGAAIATGEYLLFLHADTLLPRDYAAQVRQTLELPGVVAGAFRFAIAGEFPGRSFIERATNWRARRRQLPYGDQGLFLRRELFHGIGRFPELPLLEDYVLVRRLRTRGRVMQTAGTATTSGRRWHRLGALRTTLINRIVVLGYHAGVSPARLARWYRGESPRRGSQKSTPPAPLVAEPGG
ncbi:MAG: TIGR04283 family arsenosugar biosynthesis glycosyltransferase, partial [Opitutaceae bacterium]